jgi:hypothetical protein
MQTYFAGSTDKVDYYPRECWRYTTTENLATAQGMFFFVFG